jgi:hypothetical protein
VALGGAQLAWMEAWLALPFLALFVVGFGYSGLLAVQQSLERGAYGHSPAGRLRREPARSSAS